MDGTRFDQWTQWIAGGAASRRGVLRGLGAAAVAAVLGARGAEEALACTKNGKECNPKKRGQCCSGTCRGHRCRSTPGALGCTINDDFCPAITGFRACPGNPDGSCVVLDNGKPFCAVGFACFSCDTGADCDVAFQATGGKCVKDCHACAFQFNRACVFPAAVQTNAAASAGGSGRGRPR